MRAKTITDEMCIAAAEALAGYVERKGMTEDYIMPRMDEPEVFVEEAVAVGLKAIEQGLARRILTREELRKSAETSIRRAIKDRDIRQEKGIVPLP